MEACFTIWGVPRPKGRARSAAFKRKDGTMGVRHYSDDKTVSFEASVAAQAAAVLQGRMFVEAVRVDIVAVLPRTKAQEHKKFPGGFLWCETKPDKDNLEKAVLDGMKGCWTDDARVVAGVVAKVRTRRGEQPRVLVRARNVTADDLVNIERLASYIEERC